MFCRTRKSLIAAAVAAGCFGALTGTAAAEPAVNEPEAQAKWHSSYASWNDPKDKGGVSIYEKASKTSNNEYVMGQFVAHDEILTIWDYHDNDRPAILKLWKGNSDPAVYYANGDNTTRKIDASFSEGQTIWIQVCTSDSANAVCTPNKAKGVS